MDEKRYLVAPLGLSYDSLLQAAIVCTKAENKNNSVFDRTTEEFISRSQLLKIIEDNKSKKLDNKTDKLQLGLF